MAGAYAAMLTPFDKKGRVNGEAIDAQIELELNGGLKCFYPTGLTGEEMLLTHEERTYVYDACALVKKFALDIAYIIRYTALH